MAEERINDPLIADVQQKLRDLGYYAVGPIDGWIDPKGETAAAILDFRNQNDMPLTPTVDQKLLDALGKAPPRKIPLRRSEATLTDVTTTVPVARQNWWTRFWAKVFGIPAVGLAGVNLVINNMGDASEKVAVIKTFFSGVEIPAWVWFIGLGGVALVIGISAGKTATAVMAGYKEGSIKENGQ